MALQYRIADSLYRYLDLDGDGTGTKQVTGDYSVTADRFYIHSNTRPMIIHRMIVSIADAINPSSDEYGNLGSALSNGISVTVKDPSNTTVLDLTDGAPITTNADWGKVCYDVTLTSFGAGDDFVQVRWTFAKSGRAIELPADYSFGIDVNDSFTGLNSHTFMVQGHYAD